MINIATVLCLHEIQRAKDRARPNIPGMALVAEHPHSKHGRSVFVRDGMKVKNISVCEEIMLISNKIVPLVRMIRSYRTKCESK